MTQPARLAQTLATLLALCFATACTDPSTGDDTFDSTEDGVLGRLFGKLTGFFSEKAAEDHDIAPAKPWEKPADVVDPTVDELFDTMGLVEVQPDVDPSYDGALVGLFEHFPDEDDEDDAYDSVCFFAQSEDQMPSTETLYWAEMYGFRADSGEVSDIEGQPIGMECVGCEEGNVDGAETRVIFYVNGIKTDTDKHCDTLQFIANTTGAVTIGILNETEGMVKDIWQTTWDRFTVQVENKLADWGIDKTVTIHENKAAKLLANVVVQRIRQGKHVEIWAHSQGGAVTSLALHRAIRALAAEDLYPVKDDKGDGDPTFIKVVTFGSAASQWPEGMWPKGPVYTHYVHRLDATPSALGVGALGGYLTLGKQRAGGDAKVVFFEGAPPDYWENEEPSYSVLTEEEANVSFTELEPEIFHDITSVYLPMYEQKNGNWNE